MKKIATYFKIIGGIELFAFVGSLIWWLIDTIGGAYLTRGSSLIISFVLLGIILLFGPALFKKVQSIITIKI